MAANRKQFWRYVRGLAAPVLLWSLFVIALVQPLQTWLQGESRYDEGTILEWIEETRIFGDSLPEMARELLQEIDQARSEAAQAFGAPIKADHIGDFLAALESASKFQLAFKRERIQEHLKSMGSPLKMYAAQLPSFPAIYRLELAIDVEAGLPPLLIAWDSRQTRRPSQFRSFVYDIEPRARLTVQYQLHAYNKQQHNEQVASQRFRWVGLLAVLGTLAAFAWVFLVQHRERERERLHALGRQQLDQAEHRRLEEELRRREAEQRHEETERKLLEQRLATQAAEQQALELKSRLYASIGIMAGSYAHNIKNLLVRPNDLLRRCLEVDGLSPNQEFMLREVRQTLGTVTERLQQILRTVRRDPSQSELVPLDLNALLRELQATWQDLAQEKWKLALTLELDSKPLWIEADLSHLQQAVENLLFNARDATFEMRNHLRDEARGRPSVTDEQRRQALIAAAAWRGAVALRAYCQNGRAILEVQDNGIGMTPEIRRRCTETHFSTKRDNAIYEGNSTGMGLGLSFVMVILEHHGATLEIDSEPLRGAWFRASFPLVAAPVASAIT